MSIKDYRQERFERYWRNVSEGRNAAGTNLRYFVEDHHTYGESPSVPKRLHGATVPFMLPNHHLEGAVKEAVRRGCVTVYDARTGSVYVPVGQTWGLANRLMDTVGIYEMGVSARKRYAEEPEGFVVPKDKWEDYVRGVEL